MFSRSDKSEDAPLDPMAADQESGERGPLVMALLAGLLALAGAFLLVWYLSNGSDPEVASEVPAQAEPTEQVLVVTSDIASGTSADEIALSPELYLSARAVPADFIAPSAIRTTADLDELAGLTLSSDALAGQQLLRSQFINRADFDNEAFIQRVAAVEAPAGHHQVVLTLPAERALGGNIRGGDEVTIISGFRVDPGKAVLVNDETSELEVAEFELDPYEVSIVVLNTVEVLNVDAAGDAFLGQASDDAEFLGSANAGIFQITVAVEPHELTDLTYAMEYGNITLAVAIPDTNNEDWPRAATRINEVVGDDGVWVDELEDGKTIQLLGLPQFGENDEDPEFIIPEDDDDPAPVGGQGGPIDPSEDDPADPEDTDPDANLVEDGE